VKFTVVGGGPVGCLISILLARRGHQVEVYDRRADPRNHPPEAGRSINLALAARGMCALSEAGVLDALTPHMVPMPGRQLHLPDGSEAFSPYGQFEGEVNQSISRSELTRQLVFAAGRQPGITLHFRQRCLGLAASGALQMRDEDDGRTWELAAERVVGADGAGSALRKALAAAGHVEASNELLDHDYKELTIPPVDGSSALAVREALHIWPRHNFMLIALPNADHSFTATLFMPRTGAVGFEALAAPGAARAFFEREFPDALALMPEFDQEFAAHPQGVLGTVRCRPWNLGERIVLIGDAAHAIVPFHGQGLNCGLEDCRILDALLADGRPEPFRRFSEARRADADAIAEMSLENYAEMRDAVADPRHQVQRQLELMLERRHPGRFIPRYAMVMFHHRIPYATALSRGRTQQQVLDQLVPEGTREAAFLDGLDWQHADALVRERLQPIGG
jgi:kynurenine 3-monooxygenase